MKGREERRGEEVGRFKETGEGFGVAESKMLGMPLLISFSFFGGKKM